MCTCVSHSVVSNCLQLHGLYPIRLLRPRDSLGKNTGVGNHFLIQGIFWTPGLNSGLLCCRQILYRLSQQINLGKPLSLFFGFPFITGHPSSSLSYRQCSPKDGPMFWRTKELSHIPWDRRRFSSYQTELCADNNHVWTPTVLPAEAERCQASSQH